MPFVFFLLEGLIDLKVSAFCTISQPCFGAVSLGLCFNGDALFQNPFPELSVIGTQKEDEELFDDKKMTTVVTSTNPKRSSGFDHLSYSTVPLITNP